MVSVPPAGADIVVYFGEIHAFLDVGFVVGVNPQHNAGISAGSVRFFQDFSHFSISAIFWSLLILSRDS